MSKMLKISEEKLDILINEAFITGASYGIAEYLKSKGQFENVRTKELMRELRGEVDDLLYK